jgi:hypothetical protein
MARCNSRRLVELLAVRPHFPFLGTFLAFNDFSEYSCSSQTGETCRNLDSQVYIHSCDISIVSFIFCSPYISSF